MSRLLRFISVSCHCSVLVPRQGVEFIICPHGKSAFSYSNHIDAINGWYSIQLKAINNIKKQPYF